MKILSTIALSIFALASLSPSVATAQNNAASNTANNATLNVKITNTPVPVTAAAPLPVTVIAPVVPATVACYMNIGFNSSTSPYSVFGGYDFLLRCPQGVNRISVSRVIYDPDNGPTVSNVAGYRLLLALDESGQVFGLNSTIIAMLTEGAPDVSLSNPVAIGMAQRIAYHISCFSGVATLAATCEGSVIFIGTPINE